ncbi:hypothetical protein JL722_1494 [Aureococcus anophagefferens]|nr:hypothetical protein JL722_1494 [Aureococcus anophagefferens]
MVPLACSEAVATLIDGSRHAQSLTAARANRGPPESAAVARMMRIALVALAAALAAPPDDDAAAPDGDAAGVDWQRRRVVRVFASPFAGSSEAPAYAMTDALGRGYTCGLDGAAAWRDSSRECAALALKEEYWHYELCPGRSARQFKPPKRGGAAPGASHALGAFSSAAGEASLEEVADVFGDVASVTLPPAVDGAPPRTAHVELYGRRRRRLLAPRRSSRASACGGAGAATGGPTRSASATPRQFRQPPGRDHDGFGVLPAADAAASRDPGGFAIGAFSHVAVAPATGALSHVFTGGDACDVTDGEPLDAAVRFACVDAFRGRSKKVALASAAETATCSYDIVVHLAALCELDDDADLHEKRAAGTSTIDHVDCFRDADGEAGVPMVIATTPCDA